MLTDDHILVARFFLRRGEPFRYAGVELKSSGRADPKPMHQQTRRNDSRGGKGKMRMSAQWYYMASGWFQTTKRIGPITEHDLLVRIDQGKVQPETLVQSPKTRNQWVPMSSVGPAMQRWQKMHPTEGRAS